MPILPRLSTFPYSQYAVLSNSVNRHYIITNTYDINFFIIFYLWWRFFHPIFHPGLSLIISCATSITTNVRISFSLWMKVVNGTSLGYIYFEKCFKKTLFREQEKTKSYSCRTQLINPQFQQKVVVRMQKKMKIY